MTKNLYAIKARVWLYPGLAGWHFISIPKKESTAIKIDFDTKKRGWGSLPVQVTVGKTTWDTSIFPDKKSGVYLLPLKAAVRKKENIFNNEMIKLIIKITP